MDLVVYSSVLPREGETVFGNSFETFLGGKGANQAVAASRLGPKSGGCNCLISSFSSQKGFKAITEYSLTFSWQNGTIDN